MYYTFSTISQTLATGLGLLAAVVLFRLDKLDRNFHELVTFTVNFWRDSSGKDFQAKEDWDALLQYLKSVPHK